MQLSVETCKTGGQRDQVVSLVSQQSSIQVFTVLLLVFRVYYTCYMWCYTCYTQLWCRDVCIYEFVIEFLPEFCLRQGAGARQCQDSCCATQVKLLKLFFSSLPLFFLPGIPSIRTLTQKETNSIFSKSLVCCHTLHTASCTVNSHNNRVLAVVYFQKSHVCCAMSRTFFNFFFLQRKLEIPSPLICWQGKADQNRNVLELQKG